MCPRSGHQSPYCEASLTPMNGKSILDEAYRQAQISVDHQCTGGRLFGTVGRPGHCLLLELRSFGQENPGRKLSVSCESKEQNTSWICEERLNMPGEAETVFPNSSLSDIATAYNVSQGREVIRKAISRLPVIGLERCPTGSSTS